MIEIKATGNTTLHTAGKYCTEDILVKVPNASAENPIPSRLPAEYNEVKCLCSSGTQYIDTGFKHNQNTRIVMDVQVIAKPSSHAWLFEGRTQKGSTIYGCKGVFLVDGTTWSADYNVSADRATIDSIGILDYLQIDYNKNVLTINDFVYTWDVTEFQSDTTLKLLACDTSGTVNGHISAKLYSCQIYDNDELIRDLVPCIKVADGEAGMYDIVNNVFYTNAGTYTFGYELSTNKTISLQDKTFTENGTYKADEGYDGFGNVTVDVEKEIVVNDEELNESLKKIIARYQVENLPAGITTIGEYAFYNYSNLKLTELPDTLTLIGSSAFSSCSNLAITTFPRGLNKLNDYCFSSCTGLTTLTIPDNIRQIGAMVFQYCIELESVTFEDVCSINPNAFSGCTQSTLVINVPWAEGEVNYAPWGATKATINYNYTGE